MHVFPYSRGVVTSLTLTSLLHPDIQACITQPGGGNALYAADSESAQPLMCGSRALTG